MFNPTNIDMFIILFPEITQPTFRIVYLDKTRYGVGLATYHKPVDSFFVQYKPAGKFHSHLKSEDWLTANSVINGDFKFSIST